jgi:hypothetical protein
MPLLTSAGSELIPLFTQLLARFFSSPGRVRFDRPCAMIFPPGGIRFASFRFCADGCVQREVAGGKSAGSLH